MSFFRSALVGASLFGFLAACETPSPTASPNVQPLPDGTLTATIDNAPARLTVVDGQPVAYTYADYTAQNVRRLRDGGIAIDQARISNVQVTETGFTGNWRLGNFRTDVNFSL